MVDPYSTSLSVSASWFSHGFGFYDDLRGAKPSRSSLFVFCPPLRAIERLFHFFLRSVDCFAVLVPVSAASVFSSTIPGLQFVFINRRVLVRSDGSSRPTPCPVVWVTRGLSLPHNLMWTRNGMQYSTIASDFCYERSWFSPPEPSIVPVCTVTANSEPLPTFEAPLSPETIAQLIQNSGDSDLAPRTRCHYFGTLASQLPQPCSFEVALSVFSTAVACSGELTPISVVEAGWRCALTLIPSMTKMSDSDRRALLEPMMSTFMTFFFRDPPNRRLHKIARRCYEAGFDLFPEPVAAALITAYAEHTAALLVAPLQGRRELVRFVHFAITQSSVSRADFSALFQTVDVPDDPVYADWAKGHISWDSRISKPAFPSKASFHTWNVAGLRSRLEDGTWWAYLDRHKPDVVVAPESKCDVFSLLETCPDFRVMMHARGYTHVSIVWCLTKTGHYNFGLMIASKVTPTAVHFEDLALQEEGRCIRLSYPLFELVGVYAPCSSMGTADVEDRRNRWDVSLHSLISSLHEKKRPVLLMGDLNVTATTSDYDIRSMRRALTGVACSKDIPASHFPSCKMWERNNFLKLLEIGAVSDCFRALVPTPTSADFTWNQTPKHRACSLGMRVDYLLVPPSWLTSLVPDLPQVLTCSVLENVQGSDHKVLAAQIQFSSDTPVSDLLRASLPSPSTDGGLTPVMLVDGKEYRTIVPPPEAHSSEDAFDHFVEEAWRDTPPGVFATLSKCWAKCAEHDEFICDEAFDDSAPESSSPLAASVLPDSAPRTVSDSSGKTWDISEIYGCADLRQTRRHLPVVTAIVEGPRVRFPHPVACMFDTGSCLTLMTTDCAEELGADPLECHPSLLPTYHAANGTKDRCVGLVQIVLSFSSRKMTVFAWLVRQCPTPLLIGSPTMRHLGVICDFPNQMLCCKTDDGERFMVPFGLTPPLALTRSVFAVYCQTDTYVPPNGHVCVPVRIPGATNGTWGLVYNSNRVLDSVDFLVCKGVLSKRANSDHVVLMNLSASPLHLRRGERVATFEPDDRDAYDLHDFKFPTTAGSSSPSEYPSTSSSSDADPASDSCVCSASCVGVTPRNGFRRMSRVSKNPSSCLSCLSRSSSSSSSVSPVPSSFPSPSLPRQSESTERCCDPRQSEPSEGCCDLRLSVARPSPDSSMSAHDSSMSSYDSSMSSSDSSDSSLTTSTTLSSTLVSTDSPFGESSQPVVTSVQSVSVPGPRLLRLPSHPAQCSTDLHAGTEDHSSSSRPRLCWFCRSDTHLVATCPVRAARRKYVWRAAPSGVLPPYRRSRHGRLHARGHRRAQISGAHMAILASMDRAATSVPVMPVATLDVLPADGFLSADDRSSYPPNLDPEAYYVDNECLRVAFGEKPLSEITIDDTPRMTEMERIRLQRMLYNFRDIFVRRGDLPCTPAAQALAYDIQLHDRAKSLASWPAVKRRPVHPEARKTALASIQEQAKAGIIRPSLSPYTSPCLLVPKPGGKWRFCVNFIGLNRNVKMDGYSLPRIDETISLFDGKTHFSTLDLQDSFWSIPLTPRSAELTAFTAPDGSVWEYTRLPMGIRTGPSVFSRFIDQVLRGLRYNVCVNYIDDFCIWGVDFETHLAALDAVFSRVREYGLSFKPSKCYLLTKEFHFLGHVISHDGVRADPAKLKAIADLPMPKNKTDLSHFLGLTGFYRRLIRDFARISHPLTACTRKEHKLPTDSKGDVLWSVEERRAFHTLQKCLSTDPVVSHPDWQLPFVLTTDACKHGLGAVLTQEVPDAKGQKIHRVISYASRTTTPVEQNKFKTFELEMAAVAWAVNLFRMYLAPPFGRKFTIRTDNSSVVSALRKTDHVNTRVLKWLIDLSAFDFEAVHKAGKANPADGLSRCPLLSTCPYGSPNSDDSALDIPPVFVCGAFAADENTAFFDPEETQAWDFKTFCKLQQEDKTCQKIVEKLKGEPSGNTHRDFRIEDKDGYAVLVYSGPRDKDKSHGRLVVPDKLKAFLLHHFHGAPLSNHNGRNVVLRHLSQRYYWRNMFSDVDRWIAACCACQCRKTPRP